MCPLAGFSSSAPDMTRLWHDLNAGGVTVFLEHHEKRRQRVLSRDPDLDVLPVEYSTSILQWRELLDRPDSLSLRLPARVRDARWDVILVDAPNGFAHVAHHATMRGVIASREERRPIGRADAKAGVLETVFEIHEAEARGSHFAHALAKCGGGTI